jgi:D-3-phosphoglycerate dehydrogenase / 2-oxoglutarate reductase
MARVLMGALERAVVVEDPDPSLDALLEAAGISVIRLSEAPNEAELIKVMQTTRAQVLFKRSRVPVSRALIEACPDLFAIQLCCIGDDSVDKQACADHGVLVFNDPVSNGRSVVELVIAHLISLSRRLFETDSVCRQGIWEKNNVERYEIKGKTLGILGLGNIGRQVARAAEALGMHIRFFDSRYAATEVGVEFGWESMGSIDELMAGSDYVTVHFSATDARGESNENILTRAHFEMLGQGLSDRSPRIFLNLSRGFLFEPADLLAAIESGAIRRAAVDVYPCEPRGKEAWENPYTENPRVVVTPHIGAATQEAQPRIAQRVAWTLGQFSKNGTVRDMVFSPRARLGLVDPRSRDKVLLAVAHSTARGTKRAVDDAIYQSGASNLSSVHKDFESLGVAYDLSVIDRPLTEAEVHRLIEAASQETGDASAIRSVRQLQI